MICEKNKCVGCFACYNICPTKAIEMIEDEFGYIYPNINKEICINCGACKKTCPAINKSKFKYPQKAFVSYSKSKEINKSSASGGIAYEMYKKVIENGGVGYGVSSYSRKNKIEFCRIAQVDEIKKIQGSKYVHAYTNDCYSKVKNDLNKKIDVIFIGTPCQVDGLKFYLKKDYENLICIDLICHGVPSQKFLEEEIGQKYKYINFRGEEGFKLIAKNENLESIYEKSKNISKYYIAFLNALDYRENCYDCKYAKKERVSDITIGDFWGLDDKEIINKSGNSLILVNSEKGNNFIENLNSIFLKQEKLDVAFKGNAQLNKPVNKKKEYFKFKKYYKDGQSFEKSISKTMKKRIIYGYIKEKVKMVIKWKKR